VFRPKHINGTVCLCYTCIHENGNKTKYHRGRTGHPEKINEGNTVASVLSGRGIIYLRRFCDNYAKETGKEMNNRGASPKLDPQLSQNNDIMS
jgi:hypothetical protein